MSTKRKAPRIERIGDATLYLGDCLEVLPTLDKVDAVVTDPPYGIGIDGKWYANPERWSAPTAVDYGCVEWDEKPASITHMKLMMAASTHQVIFGGNYFEGLPPTQCWLVWDKDASGNFADCELAWTNLKQPVKRIRYLWNGFKKQKPEERNHPTQKPLTVMEWAIKQCKTNPQTILDPFMGSGTTGVACANLGRKFIGIEIEEKYFDIACERISAAYAQGRLFA